MLGTSGVTFAPPAVNLTMSTYRHVLQGVVGAVVAQTGGVDERLRRRASQRRDEFDHCPFGLAFESRFVQAYNEEAFLYFLEIERRRAELAQLPFLLLLVDLRKQPGMSPRLDLVAEKLFSTLATCVRETDFLGWYHEGTVAGAVLTQHDDSAMREVPDLVNQRIAAALRAAMPREVALRLRVTVHQLPASVKGEANA
jgi:hypothetical protein